MICMGGPMDGAEFPKECVPDHGVVRAGISIRCLPLSEDDRNRGHHGSVWEWDENSPAMVVQYLSKSGALKFHRMMTPRERAEL
jgi:hypothetical protein